MATPTPALPLLPNCEHRGEPVTHTAPGSGAVRQGFECFQPHVRGPNEFGFVTKTHCEDCGYSNAKFDEPGYRQSSRQSPTIVEFRQRYAACQSCELREGNYCPKSIGICSLTGKLAKPDFCCPLGKFQKIERE